MKLSFSTRGWQHLSWEELLVSAEESGMNGIELYDLFKRDDLIDRACPFDRYRADHAAKRGGGELPLALEEREGIMPQKVLYEPNAEAVFDRIVPEFLGGIILGALTKSIASEQAARRQAMNSATKNADEIIAALDLQYNRARQGAITQEITEIVAGSNAQS